MPTLSEIFDKRKILLYQNESLDLVNEDRTYSGFSYFMDGARRTYKIGDMVLEGKKIYPVVVAQIRAGCTERGRQKKLHTRESVQRIMLRSMQPLPKPIP